MEYQAELFMVDYSTRSIGWETVEWRPYKRAEQWMNEQAKDGWELDRFEPGRDPTELYVVMKREVRTARQTR